MRTLSLFSGIGGLDLGVHAALRCLGLEPRSVGYAEREAFAQAVLVAWMEDEGLGPAPIIEDVSDPILGECPADLVVAGFPCQPASVAGNRAGTADERWLWPLVAGCVRQVGPQLVFLENVPGLLTVNGGRAFAEVLGDLADLGFDAEWTVLGAHAVGAPHRRERLFLLAWRQLAHGHREPRPLNSPIARSAGSGNGSKPRVRGAGIWPPGPNDTGSEPVEGRGEVAHADGSGLEGRGRLSGRGDKLPLGVGGAAMAHADGDGLNRFKKRNGESEPERETAQSRVHAHRYDLAWPPGPNGAAMAHGHREPRPLNSPIARSAGSGNGSKPRVRGAGIWPPGPNDAAGWRQWLEAGGPPPAIEPGVRGVPDGPAGGMVESLAWRADRLRALGNAVVPAQAEAAFLMLWERAGLRMTRGTG